MELIEIDVIRAQAPQAVLGRLSDVLAACAMTRFIELRTELGGNDGFVTPTRERAAEILLATTAIIDIRGIKEIDSGVERSLHDASGLRGIDATSEVIAA